MTTAASYSPLTSDEASQAFAGLEGCTHLLVAVSGGPDSVALLGLLARWRADRAGGPKLSAVTVDHGLRAVSLSEAEAVARLCARFGVPHAILHWTGDKPETGLQAAARAARYGLIAAHAQSIGADMLVTAHTQDDQAETVLMRLAAGSGPAGLAGMRQQVARGTLRHHRPVLDFAKSRLVATCTALDLPFVTDPSNSQPRFARSRWRALMPQLAAEGLTTERLARFASRAAQLDEVVEARAAAVRLAARGVGNSYQACTILDEPMAVAVRVLEQLVREGETDRAYLRLERLERLHGELLAAYAAGQRLRRSIAGSIVTLSSKGQLDISLASPRKRGHSPQL